MAATPYPQRLREPAVRDSGLTRAQRGPARRYQPIEPASINIIGADGDDVAAAAPL
jgi:hypothetical protein